MGGLLIAQGSAQDARKAQERSVAAGEANRAAVGADQFALNAKRRGIERNEMNVFKLGAINSFTEHAREVLTNPSGKSGVPR